MLVGTQLEKVFSKEYELNVTMGVEMEVYVVFENKETLGDRYIVNMDDELIREIYDRMDERVYRDFYPYQLELRTNPSDEPKEVWSELIELFNEAKKVARGLNCKLIPISYLEDKMFCGMHVHVSFTPRQRTKDMIKKIIASYPFILDVTRLTLSSPGHEEGIGYILSKRLFSEMHTATPPVNHTLERLGELWTVDVQESSSCRFYDIILNTNTRDGRRRVKDVDTIEVRAYDVVGSRSTLKDVLELTYNIYKYINHDWIMQYRRDYRDRNVLNRVYRTIRRNVLSPQDYINPFTGTEARMLSEFLLNRPCQVGSWIHVFWWDYNGFCKPEFHSDTAYLIP